MIIQSLLALLLIVDSPSSAEDDPIADTPLGKVSGFYLFSRSGKRFMGFLGIPYAKPPIGNLTFEEAVPADVWNGTRNGTKNSPECIYYNIFEKNITGTMDCLYLSVYTHDLSGKAAVLVRFHGGGYASGESSGFGPEYLMDYNIIIVTVNFRIGIYGFLSFEDEDMPGNLGLKDQVESLRWVQRNIASFGGDPNKVTIIGESAGGVYVSHHTVSPLSKGLFHGAIAESGSSYSLLSVKAPGESRNVSMEVLSKLGCGYKTTKGAIECMKKKDPIKVKTLIHNGEFSSGGYLFGPVLEKSSPGAFLVGPVKKWKHHPVPLLTGITSGEGLILTIPFLLEQMDNFTNVLPLSLGYSSTSSNPENITQALLNYYFPGRKADDIHLIKDWRNLTMIHTNGLYSVAMEDQANNHQSNVYVYLFDYVGQYDPAVMLPYGLSEGSAHIAECIYLWRREKDTLTGNDLIISNNLVRLWINFIRFGDPNPKDSFFFWDTWTPNRKRLLYIDEKGFWLKEYKNSDIYTFWKSLNYRDKIDDYLYKTDNYSNKTDNYLLKSDNHSLKADNYLLSKGNYLVSQSLLTTFLYSLVVLFILV